MNMFLQAASGVAGMVREATEVAQGAVKAAVSVGGFAQNAGRDTAEAMEVTATSMSFWDLFTSGGWLMWVLLVLGGVAIFLFVERFVAIWKSSKMEMNFMNRIRDRISEGSIDLALDACKRTDTPIARMVEKGIERIGRPMSEIQNAIENQANLEVSRLGAGLPYLAMISGGAPMIGFLGTVVGLVQAFMAMENMGGTVDISVLAGGMYVAMLTTVGGLVVGIPAYFGYNYLVARIDRLIFKMEANSIAFMDILNRPVGKK
jgi:biopolymer transport protein ExbB